MDRGSLRVRMLLLAGLTLALGLTFAGFALSLLFERHVERRLVVDLETDLRELMAGLVVDDAGHLALRRRPGNQLYSQPFSGRYWQISSDAGTIERSRSLWDESLYLPPDVLAPDSDHIHRLPGPQQKSLLLVERLLSVDRPGGNFHFRIAAAIDWSQIAADVADFRTDLAIALFILGTFLLAAYWLAVGVGLGPLGRLRASLVRLRSGADTRLGGDFPSEVAPLVDDLNQLLDAHEKMIERARARAGDLAHGLKTPLTAISVLAEELEERGDVPTSRDLAGHVASMQRHIEHELALARSAHAPNRVESTSLRPLAERLVATLKRLPQGGELHWSLAIDPALSLAISDIALAEILGNLLDNARKWAKRRVSLTADRQADGSLVIEIADDGPGVPEQQRAIVLDRGRRLDETVQGSGLGLAIAADILEQLGGTLDIAASPLGGLLARINLPARLVRQIPGFDPLDTADRH